MDSARHQLGLRVTPSSLAYAEPWPGGGWAVKLANHPTPVSRHDTEAEARDKAASYQRGLENEKQEVQADRGDFHALWREGNRGSDHLRRLGHDIQEYEARHRQSAEGLREHGQLGGGR